MTSDSNDEHLRRLARVDRLTGFWNLRFLDENLEDMVKKAGHRPMPLSISLVDVDDMKCLNHLMGHRAGDLALKEIARVLKFAYPERSLVSRVGGDEFAVLSARMPVSRILEFAETTRRSIKRISLRLPESLAEPISVTVGISSYPQDGRTSGELLVAADQAVWRGKQQGGDQVVLA